MKKYTLYIAVLMMLCLTTCFSYHTPELAPQFQEYANRYMNRSIITIFEDDTKYTIYIYDGKAYIMNRTVISK